MRGLLRTARGRTLFGLILAVLFVPVMLGISACLETPIGDPEQGWVDPRITGVWLAGDPVPDDFNATLWVFEPYDGRTWLVTWAGYAVPDEEAGEEPPADETGTGTDGGSATTGSASTEAVTMAAGEPVTDGTPDGPAAPLPPSDVLRILGSLADERVEPQGQLLFKGWLTSIAERRFLVLERKLSIGGEKAFEPGLWLVYRVVLKGDRMQFAMVTGGVEDPSVEDLSSVKSRGIAEQYIARHVADPQLYDEAGPAWLYRIPESNYQDVSDLLERSGFEPAW